MSKITFYKTEITPERNAWIDDIYLYLREEGVQTYTRDDIQYQKIGLNISVVVAADQAAVGNQSLGNYCELEQDNYIYYFFIINTEWVSRSAVRVNLSMDTINTFGEKLKFTTQTTIEREHRDRLVPYGAAKDNKKTGTKTTYRLIDRQPENLPLLKHQTKNLPIQDTFGDYDWFLIYKTRDDLTPTNTANPVECSLVADKPLLYKKAGTTQPEVVIEANSFIENNYYYATPAENPGLHIILPNGIDRVLINTEVLMCQRESTQGLSVYVLHYVNDAYSSKELLSHMVSKITFKQGNLFRYSSSQLFDTVSMEASQLTLPIAAGENKDVFLKTIKEIDKTDSKLMKIIRLPYCPVNFTKNSYGEIIFPDDWKFKEGRLVLKTENLSSEFYNSVAQVNLKPYLAFNAKVEPKSPRLFTHESKLYSSEFLTYKFVYDSFAKDIKLENFKIDSDYNGENFNLPIYFKQTNTVNSKFAFNVDADEVNKTTYIHEGDYDNYLIVNRNNEETIFSNDYINYIRNGYNYDKKQKDRNLVSDMFGVFSGIGQATLSGLAGVEAKKSAEKQAALREIFGLPKEEQTFEKAFDITSKHSKLSRISRTVDPFLSAAAISAGFGAVNGLVSTLQNHIEAEQAIARKLQELGNQSTAVSGADDVDLLKAYSGNRLSTMTYDIDDLPKQSVADLFHFAGYSHPVQGIPETDNRYWFNYIKCQPVFSHEHTSIYSNYLDDIKARFANGITKYHHHREILPSWDIEQQYENWETNLLNTSYLTTDKLELGAKDFIQREDFHNIISWTSLVPTTNDYVLEFRYRHATTNRLVYAETTIPAQAVINLPNYKEGSTISVRRRNRWYEPGSSDWTNIF